MLEMINQDKDMKISFKCNAAGIVFEQHCPQCDLNVLVHWLFFFKHHGPQLTDSSFNHLSLPPSWSEYYLFSFSRSTILPLDGQLFKECREVLMSFLLRILQIRPMFLFDNLSCTGIKSHLSKIMSIHV